MYAFGQVTVTWGSHILTGFAPGTPVNFKRNVPRISTQVGSDGKGCDTKTSNNSGLCEVTMQQSSPSVAYINAQAKLDTRQALVIRDLNGTELNRAMMRVMGEAESVYGEALGERKFSFTSIDVSIDGGGGHEV